MPLLDPWIVLYLEQEFLETVCLTQKLRLPVLLRNLFSRTFRSINSFIIIEVTLKSEKGFAHHWLRN